MDASFFFKKKILLKTYSICLILKINNIITYKSVTLINKFEFFENFFSVDCIFSKFKKIRSQNKTLTCVQGTHSHGILITFP